MVFQIYHSAPGPATRPTDCGLLELPLTIQGYSNIRSRIQGPIVRTEGKVGYHAVG